jgi:hypothetical protein
MQPLQTSDIGQEIYDAIMGVIEPELTTSQLPLLAQKYAQEGATEKSKRMGWYAKAFKIFDEAFNIYVRGIEDQMRVCKKSARLHAEGKSMHEDAHTQDHLLSQISIA